VRIIFHTHKGNLENIFYLREERLNMVKVVEVNDGNFAQEVLASSLPVLVDFWAEWCAPCKMVSPVVEEIAVQFEGRLKVASLNVDDNPITASQYSVMSIPSLLLLKGGSEVERIVGAYPKKHLISKLEGIL
jgi:thioredoxin 1